LILNAQGKYEIFRTALLVDEHTKTFVVRGLQIVTMLQQYASHVGPSLLIETQPYAISSRLSDSTFSNLCVDIQDEVKKLDKAKKYYEFALQHVEYCEGGIFDNRVQMTDEEFDFCCYSLLWFFKTTIETFSFRHRDLKTGNIVVRNLDKPESFRFFTTATQTSITFTSRFVPVVIDYDFASVYTTTTESDRNNVGTRHTAPPRALMAELLHTPQTQRQEESYDWWSLGIVLFQVAMQPFILKDMFYAFQPEEDAFEQISLAILQPSNQTRAEVRVILRGLMYGLCARAIVLNDMKVPTYIPEGFKLQIQNIMQSSQNMNNVHSIYAKRVAKQTKRMLANLLSYNDSKRGKDFNQWFVSSAEATPSAVLNVFSDEMPSGAQVKRSLSHPLLKFKL
jgi:serine/threonine protein kinase